MNNHLFPFVLFSVSALPLVAQRPETAVGDSVQLAEAVVDAPRVVQEADRVLLYPTGRQIASAVNAYSLLRQLPLKHVRVDVQQERVSSPLGGVTVFLNDAPATKSDLQALNLRTVRRIELIDNPGVRYGDGVAAVVRIVTRRADSGYLVGITAQAPVDTRAYSGNAYARVVAGRSEWSLDCNGSFLHTDGASSHSTAQYALADGTLLTKRAISRDDCTRTANQGAQLRYTFRDAEKCTVQATFNAGHSRTPHHRVLTEMQVGDVAYEEKKETSERVFSPSLELYGQYSLSPNQTLIANFSGNFIESRYAYRNELPGHLYGYEGDGSTRALSTELLYEHRFKRSVLVAGAEYRQQYIANVYSGGTDTATRLRSSFLRGYAEWSGRVGRLSYRAGVGVSRNYFRQGAAPVDECFFRPQATVAYGFAKMWQARYTFTSVPYISRMQYVTDVTVQTDELTVKEGNPGLRAARRTEHAFDLTCNHPRIQTTVTAFYRNNAHPVMQKIYRNEEGLFVHTFANQKACNMFFLSNYTNWQLVPEKLALNFSAGYHRFMNRGEDYKHVFRTFYGTAALQAYLGRFTLGADVSSGWRFAEGESRGEERPSYSLWASYRVPVRKGHELTLQLYAAQMGLPNPVTQDLYVLNRYVSMAQQNRSRDRGNQVALTLSWQFARGRKVGRTDKRLQAPKVEAGMMR